MQKWDDSLILIFDRNDLQHVGTETGAIFAGETKEINKDNYFDAHEKQ